MTIKFCTELYLIFHCFFPGIEKCPHKLPEDEWTDSIYEWSQIEYHDLSHYLIKRPSKYLARSFMIFSYEV